MQGQHGTVAAPRFVGDQFQQGNLVVQVEMAGGFVEQEQGGGLGQQGGKGQTLAFAA